MTNRLQSISNRLDTCLDCGFTALFMYKDAAGIPLCPKCSHAEIQAFKDVMADLDEGGIDEGLSWLTYAEGEELEAHEFDGRGLGIDELPETWDL